MGGKQNDPTVDVEEQHGDSLEISADESVPTLKEENLVEVDESEKGELAEEAEHKPESELEIDLEDVTAAIETLSQEIEVLKQTAEDNLDKALRAQAELDNVLKRTSRDIENAHKYALENFVTELLPILDSMELGISASDSGEDIANLREGMDLTLKMFVDTLEKFGVIVIDPQNEKFNPEIHEAVSMQELEDVESGSVISVMQKGYELNGRLVRPAMVMVAK